MPDPAYAPLDDALEWLSPYGTELTNGNFNHAPMVAEALCALGRPDAVLPWIEAYRPRLVPRATPGEHIDREDWRPIVMRLGCSIVRQTVHLDR